MSAVHYRRFAPRVNSDPMHAFHLTRRPVTARLPLHSLRLARVAQWLVHRPSKPRIRVRFPSRAPPKLGELRRFTFLLPPIFPSVFPIKFWCCHRRLSPRHDCSCNGVYRQRLSVSTGRIGLSVFLSVIVRIAIRHWILFRLRPVSMMRLDLKFVFHKK